MTDRLQLVLIPDLRPCVQPLAPDARVEVIELIALMLVRLVRERRVDEDLREVRDESR